jgi:hypothetical protein
MKSIKQIRESNLEEASVHLDNPFDSRHGPDHKSETKHAETMKKNHGVTTKYHRNSGEMSYHGPKKNLKAALHTHYQTDNENDIKDNHPELYEDISKKKSSDMARVNAGAMSKSEFDSKYKKPAKKSLAGPGGLYKNLVKEELGAGELGTAELTNKYKNATPGQTVEETAGHESTLAAKATAAAARNPSKEAHLNAMKAHKNAQGFFKGQAHDYHLNKAIEHAKKASEMKEDAEEDMAKHHDAAQAAKAAGDNDAFHKHMDAKFEVAKKRDAENAKKTVTRMEEDLENACWKGYEAIGMKMKNGRKVPNCVPKEGVKEGTEGYRHHIIGVTMTDPNHPMVSKRSESIFKKIKVSGSNTDDAINRAKAHYSKKGFKVSDTYHHSYVNEGTEESLDESVHSVKAAKFSQKAKLNPSISTHVRASDAHAKAASAYEKKIAAHIKSGGEASELKPLETMAKSHNRSSTLHKFMAHRLVKQGLKEAVEMAAEAADEKVNLKITRHSQLALNAEKRGDKAAQKFHLDMVSKLKAGGGKMNEGAEHDDDQEEIIMAKGQLLKIADMAKDLADSMDDEDELEAWIQAKITSARDQMDDVHSYVEYTQDLYDDQPEAEKEYATEQVNEDVASNNDAKELARMQMLVRLGLLDRLKLNTVTRAIKKLDNKIPVTTTAEKDVLFELLQNLIGAISSDESIFRKVKYNVANKSQ